MCIYIDFKIFFKCNYRYKRKCKIFKIFLVCKSVCVYIIFIICFYVWYKRLEYKVLLIKLMERVKVCLW